MTRAAKFILMTIMVTLAAPAASAATLGGVSFPDNVVVGGESLLLNGLGMREATIFKVDVYVAGLYVKQRSQDARTLITTDEIKRLRLEFVREVDREDLTEAFDEAFDKLGVASTHAKALARLNGWMASMSKGNSLTLTYQPGKGVEVRLNGKLKGTISGAGFARALWKVWLGPHPPNAGLKTGLLGKR